MKNTKSKYHENKFFSSNKNFHSLYIKRKNNFLAAVACKIIYQSVQRNIGYYWLNFFHALFNSSKGQKTITT